MKIRSMKITLISASSAGQESAFDLLDRQGLLLATESATISYAIIHSFKGSKQAWSFIKLEQRSRLSRLNQQKRILLDFDSGKLASWKLHVMLVHRTLY